MFLPDEFRDHSTFRVKACLGSRRSTRDAIRASIECEKLNWWRLRVMFDGLFSPSCASLDFMYISTSALAICSANSG